MDNKIGGWHFLNKGQLEAPWLNSQDTRVIRVLITRKKIRVILNQMVFLMVKISIPLNTAIMIIIVHNQQLVNVQVKLLSNQQRNLHLYKTNKNGRKRKLIKLGPDK